LSAAVKVRVMYGAIVDSHINLQIDGNFLSKKKLAHRAQRCSRQNSKTTLCDDIIRNLEEWSQKPILRTKFEQILDLEP